MFAKQQPIAPVKTKSPATIDHSELARWAGSYDTLLQFLGFELVCMATINVSFSFMMRAYELV
jgi:hypothetical protein